MTKQKGKKQKEKEKDREDKEANRMNGRGFRTLTPGAGFIKQTTIPAVSKSSGNSFHC